MNESNDSAGPLQRIVRRLRELATEMESVSLEMNEYARQAWDGETADHAKELRGAAEIARTWADGLGAVVDLTPNTE